MVKKVNIGLIGCGDIAHLRYLPTISRLEETELVAVCDIRRDIAEKTAKEFGAENFYTNYEELLKNEKIDAVIITTPTPTHSTIVISAAKAGKHILVEKPLCITLKEADEVIQVVQEAKVKFMPLPFDALPGYLKAKELLDSGFIGEPVVIEATATHNGVYHSGWFYQKGSGTLNDMGVYPISWAVGLFGPAESVSAFTNITIKERKLVSGEKVKAEVEDTAVLILKWPNGEVGSLSTNWATAGLGETEVSGLSRGNVIFHSTIYGTEGLMHLDFPDNLIVCSESKHIDNAKRVTYENLDCLVPTFSPEQELDEFAQRTWMGPQIISHFAECILTDKKPVCDPLQQRHVVEIIEKAYTAAKTGKAQRLSTSFPR